MAQRRPLLSPPKAGAPTSPATGAMPAAKRRRTQPTAAAASVPPEGAAAESPPTPAELAPTTTVASPTRCMGTPPSTRQAENRVGVTEQLGDVPLRLITIGHNPGQHTWDTGHCYAHPTNHYWRILRLTGLAPSSIRGPEDDALLPGVAGVGITNVGQFSPGTISADFKSHVFEAWRECLYSRLAAHTARAAASISCCCRDHACGAPAHVAFEGKRQFLELLNVGKRGKAKLSTVDVGLQPATLRPDGWPLPASTAVWVMPSCSGASALTKEQREGPWRQLAVAVLGLPWPTPVCRCPSSTAGCAT